MRNLILSAVFGAACSSAASASPQDSSLRSLQGSWVMVAAYEIKADGTRTTNYGEHPDGLMMVDGAGRYSIQIFRPDRAPFKAGTKAGADPQELRDAVLGSSTHFGTVAIDRRAHQLRFHIAAASFPNWNGQTQVRDFSYAGGVLTYRVPAAASGNGTIAYSVWRKASPRAR